MTGQLKTVRDILDSSAAYLACKTEEPRPACELLLSCLLKCKRLELPLKYTVVLSEKELEAMRRGIKRLAAGEPVQYIVGAVEFMGRILKTDRRALIPRPETEILVEKVLETESLWRNEHPLIVDMGTGSGCIAISIAAAKPKAVCIGVDISEDALALARENAESAGVADRTHFVSMDLADFLEPATIDAFTANLPYIPTRQCDRLPKHIRDFEPRIALDGGPDGLSAITDFSQDAVILLKPGGSLFMEIGLDQTQPVSALLKDLGYSGISVHRDLAGHDRIVSARVQ